MRGAIGAGALAGTVVLALLVASNRDLLGAPMHETLDLASNSLRILEAKRLELLTGNYSRLGFHHPGPAILYALAAGEWLFHDVLGWVRAPIAGQVLAACLYTATWSALLAGLLSRLAGGAWAGIAGTAAFLALTGLRDPQYFSSLWFPYLYYFPFAVLVAAAARFAQGGWDALFALVLAACVLVHGHASFVAIAGLVVLGAAVLHAVEARQWRQRGARAYLAAAFRDHRAGFLASGAVALLALLPIALHTALNFPGEIPQYVRYRMAFSGNAWAPTLDFLSAFWWGAGPWPAAAGSAAVLALLAWRPLRTLAAMLLLATLATLFYAKTGIDHLEMRYTGFFYFAVPALLAAAAAAAVATHFGRPVALGVAAAGLGVVALTAVPSNVDHDPAVARIAEQLRRAPARPVALDLDSSREWQHLWGIVVGVGLHATRAGERLVCVNANWHILFTRRLRCTPADLARGSRMRVTAQPVERNPGDGIVQGAGLSFVPLEATPMAPAGAELLLVEANARELAGHLVAGWAAPERDFTWTVGPRAVLQLRVGEPGPFVIALDVAAFIPRPQVRQSAQVLVNGVALATLEFDAGNNRALREVRVPASVPRESGVFMVEFRVAQPLSPAAAGYSADTRLLGLALHGVRILRADGT